jgi:hypothetical protein
MLILIQFFVLEKVVKVLINKKNDEKHVQKKIILEKNQKKK